MFRKNNDHRDGELYPFYEGLVDDQRFKILNEGWSGIYYRNIFSAIDETIFDPLYSSECSRPNFPVNILVSLLILKMKFNYTDEELFGEYQYDMRFRHAFGLKSFTEFPLAERTYYYFKKRLLEHEKQTDENLLEKLFKSINLQLLELCRVNKSEVRVDSTLIWSNIKNMSRLELCIESLRAFYARWDPLCSEVKEYLETGSDRYCYQVKHDQVQIELQKIGNALNNVINIYKENAVVASSDEYKLTERILAEQFHIKEAVAEPKENTELKSSFVQSPYDSEATYRKKGETKCKGYSLSVIETADEKNEVTLIVGLELSQNIKSDGQILAEQIPDLKEMEVDTVVGDGGYDEIEPRKALAENGIEVKLTGVKGRTSVEGMYSVSDFQTEGETITACPAEVMAIGSEIRNDRVIVQFPKSSCEGCDKLEQCPVRRRKKWYQLSVKRLTLRKILERGRYSPEEYLKLVGKRAVIESTMRQFKMCCYKDKIRYRGMKNITIIFIARAIAINFMRVVSFMEMKKGKLGFKKAFFIFFSKIMTNIFLFFDKNLCFLFKLPFFATWFLQESH